MRKVQKLPTQILSIAVLSFYAILKVAAAPFSADFMFHLTTLWGNSLLSRLISHSLPHHSPGHSAILRHESQEERALPCTPY